MAVNSSVARGGSSPPIGSWSMQNRLFFVLLRPIFCEKLKIAPPIRKQPPLKRLNLLNWTKNQSQFRWRPFFFGEHLILGRKNLWISDFGRKITLNFSEDLFIFLENTWFWAVKTFKFRTSAEKSLPILVKTFFFLGEHLIFGGKNLWISELSEKFRLNFRTNRLKLIQVQWKFESRSFAQFSLFQNSPPLFQILATRLAVNEYLSKYFMNWFLESSNKKPAQLIFHDFLR